MTADMVELYTKLLSMRRELVARLAGQFDGGVLALLASVDGAVTAVEAELEAEQTRQAADC